MASSKPPSSSLHLSSSKRSQRAIDADSPAYDASEEDNDPLSDDQHPPSTAPRKQRTFVLNGTNKRQQHQLAQSSVMSDSDGVDSPMYDGDVESSAASTTSTTRMHHHHNHHTSTSTFEGGQTVTDDDSDKMQPSKLAEPAPAAISAAAFDPAALTAEDVRDFVQTAIDGAPGRAYKTNPPPEGRPARVYADGVYDLFHFGHALQLRQAKLSFPEVYLLVGVNSDEQVKEHKARGIMTHAERLEAVRHCRWVDEVVADAPWIIDQAFLDKHQIDYVAHDDLPYAAEGHDDVYALVKNQGKFLPTRRTPGVSTSELLERIVSGYRHRMFDDKLEKMGHSELKAEGSDYDDSRRPSRVASPIPGSRAPGL